MWFIRKKQREAMEQKFYHISIKGGLRADAELYNDQKDDTFRISYRNDCPVHEEFDMAMQNFAFHVEEVTGMKYRNLHIDSFLRVPSGDSELITIYAHLATRGYASPTNLAVRIHLGRDEYPWAERLTEDILLCEVEALKYIKKGKRLGMEEFLIAA